MLEILQYATGNGFWTFVGCLMLVSAPLHGAAAIVSAVRGRNI